MDRKRNYVIVQRYLERGRGWVKIEEKFDGMYEEAGREASKIAKQLDELYYDDHFWTVDLINPETRDSYFQLFHGRTA